MSHATVCARPGQDRTSLYQEITDKIIADLEAGRLPWVQPWGTSGVLAPLSMPKNAATQRRYSGINVLILWGAVVQHGFPGRSWLTFRQALGMGGNVRKGERGTTVVFADRFIPDQERTRARERGDEPNAIPFLKRFTVFNVAQCDGLPDDLAIIPPPVPEGLILPEVEALIRASGADLRLGGDRAFYSPALDYIQVLRHERRDRPPLPQVCQPVAAYRPPMSLAIVHPPPWPLPESRPRFGSLRHTDLWKMLRCQEGKNYWQRRSSLIINWRCAAAYF